MRKGLASTALVLIVLAVSVLGPPALAEGEGGTPPPENPYRAPCATQDDKWTFGVTPYLWLAGIGGTLKYTFPPGGEEGDADEADVGLGLEDLNWTFMMSAEARRARWSILADLVHVDLTSESDSVDSVHFPDGRVDVHSQSDTSTDITGTEAMLAGGYTLVCGRSVVLELIGGVRYLNVRAESEWQLDADVTGPGAVRSFERHGSIARRADLWDGIVGARGELALGNRFFIPYHADVGAGSSTLTWQTAAGIGYRLKGWDVRLTYRYLRYEMGEDDLLQDVSFSGAAVGAKIRF